MGTRLYTDMNIHTCASTSQQQLFGFASFRPKRHATITMARTDMFRE